MKAWADGTTARFPGRDALAGYWGGGFPIGEQAVWHAAGAGDGRGSATQSSRSIPEFSGVSDIRARVEKLHFGRISGLILALLSPTVVVNADAAARAILDRQASEIVALAEPSSVGRDAIMCRLRSRSAAECLPPETPRSSPRSKRSSADEMSMPASRSCRTGRSGAPCCSLSNRLVPRARSARSRRGNRRGLGIGLSRGFTRALCQGRRRRRHPGCGAGIHPRGGSAGASAALGISAADSPTSGRSTPALPHSVRGQLRR